MAIPAVVHQVVNSPGRPLDAATRAALEPRFGHDFSRIRVHTDSPAAESARAVNALAYTVGDDVVFGHGQFRPGSAEGQRLIAHELAHTIQQAGGTAAQEGGRSESVLEGEADAASQAAVAGQDVQVGSAAPVGLSRQPAPGTAPTPAPQAAPAAPAAAGADTIDSFVTGRAEISATNMAKLRVIAARIQAALKDHPATKVRVVGHTDAQGNEGDNVALGQRRADNTRDALVKMGIPANKMETESKGQSEPVDDSGKKDNPRNRRVEIKLEGAAPVAPAVPQAPAGPQYDPLPADPVKPNPLRDIVFPPPLPGPRRQEAPPPPPEPKYKPKPKPSVLDWTFQNVVDPIVHAVTKPLPKDIQDKALELAHAAVVKGVTAGLDKALEAAGVDPQGRKAIVTAVEAAIKQKSQGGQP